MSVHHLNCGSLFPYWPRVEAIVYCLLVETSEGLLLVDTGFGLQDYAHPTPLMRAFMALLRVPHDPEQTAARQVVRLGFAVEDVRHVVLTHLHLDHAGGLPDFSGAEVHVYRPEYEAAMRPRGLMGRFYSAAHWAHGPRWVLHELGGDRWFGFDCVPVLEGASPRVLLVPLPGHTRGHCGVALETATGWIFHCGDAASPFHPAADPHRAVNAPLPRWARWVIGSHVPRLRALVRDHGDAIRLISGHDRYGFTRYRAAVQEGP